MAMEGGGSGHTLGPCRKRRSRSVTAIQQCMGRARQAGIGISPNVPLEVTAPGASMPVFEVPVSVLHLLERINTHT